eukprot:g627.t1
MHEGHLAKLDRYLEKVENDPGVIGEAAGLKRLELEELLQENWLGTARKRGSQERLGLLSTGLWRWMRRKVAGSRCRYVSNGFDLDLAYVTSKIIAMGFPGKSSGACFRNPQSEVQRFLRWAHGDGCFRIYNLCAERSFRENGFPDETIHFPCADHCPPQFSKILEFCRDVEAWLKVDERNVAAIHCKAGKELQLFAFVSRRRRHDPTNAPRICALLLYAGAVLSARDALRWFGHVRGGTRAGVTIPSQIRWIAMFETWLEQGVQLLSDPMGPSTGRYRPCAIQFSHLGLEGPVKVKVALVSRQDGIPQAVHRLYLQLSTCNDLLHFTAMLDGSIDSWERKDRRWDDVFDLGGVPSDLARGAPESEAIYPASTAATEPKETCLQSPKQLLQPSCDGLGTSTPDRDPSMV